MPEQALLSIRNLTVQLMTVRGIVHAVRGIDLTIQPGEIMGIVGESGCGKSITAKSILRLHDESRSRIRGEILFEGQDILKKSSREMERFRGGEAAMIFQDPMGCLDPLMTIGDQLCETLILHTGATKKEAQARALELLEMVGIHPAQKRARQYPFSFSGGMLQRVMIAIAIACKPKLLIADEPTTALDVTIQAQVLELIKRLSKEMNMAVMLITHNFGVIAELCDRVSVMYAGKIVESGDVRDIFDHPGNPYTQSLIASIPRPGKPGQRLTTIEGAPPELFSLIEGCPFAPRCQSAGANCTQGEILLSEIGHGHMVACVEVGKS